MIVLILSWSFFRRELDAAVDIDGNGLTAARASRMFPDGDRRTG
jgi:hypothetical protein